MRAPDTRSPSCSRRPGHGPEGLRPRPVARVRGRLRCGRGGIRRREYLVTYLNVFGLMACSLQSLMFRIHRILALGLSYRGFQIKPTVNQTQNPSMIALSCVARLLSLCCCAACLPCMHALLPVLGLKILPAAGWRSVWQELDRFAAEISYQANSAAGRAQISAGGSQVDFPRAMLHQ